MALENQKHDSMNLKKKSITVLGATVKKVSGKRLSAVDNVEEKQGNYKARPEVELQIRENTERGSTWMGSQSSPK